MRLRAHGDDAWLCPTITLAVTHLLFAIIVGARAGLAAVVLWYAVPPLLALSAAALLTTALVRFWRSRQAPNG